MRKDLHSTVDLGQVSIGNHLRRLVTDTDLESGGAPVNELDRTLALQGSNSTIDILRNNIAAVQKTCCHVFSIARVTLNHLVVGLEARHRNFLDRVGLVGSLGRGNYGSVGDQREMNARVGNEVGLELV